MRKNILSEYYHQHHEERGRIGFSWVETERADYFRRWIGEGKRVLDIGCRDGTLTKHYINGNEVVGLDIDLDALKYCKERFPIPIICADVNGELPFSESHFDVVVLAEVLEHTIFPELVISEVGRVLKKEGLFIGSTPNAFRLKNRLKFLLGEDFEVDKTHLHHFSLKGLKNLLEINFYDVMLLPVASRFLFLSGYLFGNSVLWKCYKR